MHIQFSDPEDMTQYATWYLANEGATMIGGDSEVTATVSRTDQPDPRGNGGRMWAWRFTFPGNTPGTVIAVNSKPNEAIGVPDGHVDPREVLETLSGFLSAWIEALEHDGSENSDLFPEAVKPFNIYADDFVCTMMEWSEGR